MPQSTGVPRAVGQLIIVRYGQQQPTSERRVKTGGGRERRGPQGPYASDGIRGLADMPVFDSLVNVALSLTPPY